MDLTHLERGLGRCRINLCSNQSVYACIGGKLIGPMHGGKQVMATLPISDQRAHQIAPILIAQANERSASDAKALGILGRISAKGSAIVRRQSGRLAGPGHGVPVVTHPTGVEYEAARCRCERGGGGSTGTKRAFRRA